MRANGRVRFLTISSRFQMMSAAALSLALVAWLAVSGIMLVTQARVSAERLAITAEAANVARTAAEVKSYRGSVEDRAAALETRQQLLETLAEEHFGKPAATAAPGAEDESAARAIPGAGKLANLERRQLAFASGVAELANARADRVRREVARLGLTAARLTGGTTGTGGPFVPALGAEALADDRFAAMTEALATLSQLENALIALPSFMPARNGSLSSAYGFRYDPITGRAAQHMGQDFRGPHGEPILAAGPGKVVNATRLNGYGNIVVLDHGKGIRTRYAHLSSIDVKPGMTVERGQQIGRMGSTGRSTGTHLHFEVRVDGRAVNPRPYLEASPHVLEIQKLAGRHGRANDDDG